MTPTLHQRIESLLGLPILSAQAILGGYSPVIRLLVSLPGGRTAFVKAGASPATSAWLRKEASVYRLLEGQEFLPRLLAWEDDSQQPLLVLEDLSAAAWPPPWSQERVERVLAALSQVADCKIPGLPRFVNDSEIALGWQPVANDPAPFLSLGLASEHWLAAALPRLLAVDGRQLLDGEALLHSDVRSDNLCFAGRRTLLVDWNWVRLGNPRLDVVLWLPSLEAEGGPPPEAILPDGGEYAAIISGFFAARAGLPVIPEAPNVRTVQLQQLRTALPWAVRALSLPPLDGELRPAT